MTMRMGPKGKSEPNAVIGVGVVMADRPMYFGLRQRARLGHRRIELPRIRSFAHEPVEGSRKTSPLSNSRCGWHAISTVSTKSKRR